jgi:hypothetical protein
MREFSGNVLEKHGMQSIDLNTFPAQENVQGGSDKSGTISMLHRRVKK